MVSRIMTYDSGPPSPVPLSRALRLLEGPVSLGKVMNLSIQVEFLQAIGPPVWY